MATNNKAPKGRSKSETFQAIAEKTGLSRKQVAAVFDELVNLIKGDLGKKGPGVFTLPGMMKITRAIKPATKAGERPNPFKPGEMMIVKAKPATVKLRLKALKSLRESVK
jgi:hypothetical protein